MTIGTESCYLQKLDLDKVIWDLEMVAAKAVLFDRHQFEGSEYGEETESTIDATS